MKSDRSAAQPIQKGRGSALSNPLRVLAIHLLSSNPGTAFNPGVLKPLGSGGLPSKSLDRYSRGRYVRDASMVDAVVAEPSASPIDALSRALSSIFSPGFMNAPDEQVSSASVLRGLFDGPIDPETIASACSEDVIWEDMSKQTAAVGRDEVRDLLASKFPEGTSLAIDRISDGGLSGGFTWYRTVDDEIGLRGTLFAELNDAGELTYVKEGCEPLFKPGEATEKLLKAVTANIEKPERTPTYTPASPRTASDIVKYLWGEAYPGGATPDVALELFADDIVYEDFNYPEPFVGKAAVTEFVTAFDIPGIEFLLLKASEGERGCAFTWQVKVNGQDGPTGISFYEVNPAGKVSYIRDIPAPSVPFGLPPPFASLAAILQPKLRVFEPRERLW